MKKHLATALIGTMACSIFTACGSTSSPSNNSAESNQLDIQVILNTTASEYWGYVKSGAEAYGKEHPDVKVSVIGPSSETAYDEQRNMIETSLSSGQYDGLVVSALQPDMAKTVLSGAEIPVIAVNADIDAPEIKTFVGTGNEEAARQGAIAAVEAAKAAGWTDIQAIEIAGPQGDITVEQRFAGFQAGIEEAGGIFLADEVQYADSVADKAVNAMEGIMQRHPEGIAVILSHNDDMAIAAARTAKNNPAYEKTIFCGFDGIQSACEAILAGDETMSVAQDAYGMGYKAVDACVRSIQGEQLEEFIDTGCEVITKENAQQRLDDLQGYLK